MAERLASAFSTIFTVIGGFFTFASFVVQRAPPVFFGACFGTPSQEALVLGRLARQGRIKILVRQLEYGYWAPGRPLNAAKIDELTAEVARLLKREEADAAAEEARGAEALAWGRFWDEKLDDIKEILALPTKFCRLVIIKYRSIKRRMKVSLSWLNPWGKARSKSQVSLGVQIRNSSNVPLSRSTDFLRRWRDRPAAEMQQLSLADG